MQCGRNLYKKYIEYLLNEKYRKKNTFSCSYPCGIDFRDLNTKGEWFKVQPIVWKILKNDGERILLVSDKALDERCFYYFNKIRKDSEGNDIYPNNYAASGIRQYLNGNFESAHGFLQQAFTPKQRERIAISQVQNSPESFPRYDREYSLFACEDTSDKIFLLSQKEVTDGSLGFRAARIMDAMRQKKASDYALFSLSENERKGLRIEEGISPWFLRTPNRFYEGHYYVRHAETSGYSDALINSDAPCGMVPALAVFSTSED